MRRRSALTALALVALATPAAALGDVFIEVPARFLGGPIGAPLARVAEPGIDGVPVAGMPSRSPREVDDPCRGEAPSDCMVWGPEADLDVPFPEAGPSGPGAEIESDVPPVVEDEPLDGDDPAFVDAGAPDASALEVRGRTRAVPAAAPPPAELAAAHDGLVFPRAADWLPWQRPVLRWRPATGARYYNVQIFRGGRRVLNAWPRRTRLQVPADVLRQGRTYVWVVWPGLGRRGDGAYGRPVGRSSFAVTLRPRIVFRPRGAGVSAEVRPHIPGGVLRLEPPRGLAGRVPATVRIGPRGRFTLGVPPRAAERLDARLIDRGDAPPVGLRR